jgi:hypothetical protein
LALLNSKRVALLDHSKLVNQLLGLERRTARSGKESIDHAPGGHDDLADAVAGLCVACLSKHGGYSLEPFQPGFIDYDAKPAAAEQPPEPPRANGDWWR